jgi:PKD repeat protein
MFEVEPPEGKAPKTVLFKQQSTGDFDNCVWTFGDGTSAEGCADQVHTYETPGEYTPRLVLSGWAGTDGYRCRGCVDIYEQVEADFSLAPEVGPAPLTVDFTNLSTGTFDTCTWEFGDGQSSSNCSGVTHVYTDKGRYTVKLTVSGDGGLAVKRVQSAVHAQDSAEEPVADFSVDPAVGPAPLLVSFTNLSTGTYDTCSWDFGDGESSSSCNGVTHVYNDLGTHTVSLIVSGAGGVDIKTAPNAVEVQAKVEEPVADFSALTRRGKPPLTVKFQDESAGTYDECTWDFGDGSRKGKGASPTHTYKRVGRYTVTMTASGSAGSDTVKKVDFVVVDPYLSFIPGVIAR